MKRPKAQKHWTENSINDYQSRITFDFLSQLDRKMEAMPMSQADLARSLGITEGAVSQVLSNQARLTLSTIIKYSRKLGLKVAVLAYDDGDPENTRGPINSELFTICWEKMGRPSDFLALEESTTLAAMPKTDVMPDKFTNVRYYDFGSTRDDVMTPLQNAA